MEKNSITTEILSYSSVSEMSQEDQRLIEAARNVIPQAYAPYSKFKVAAALRLKSGEIITGTNQENAAFPSGLCAERVAFFAAGHHHPEAVFETVAIMAHSDSFSIESIAAPCGACRQVMLEYRLKQDSAIRVILAGYSGGAEVINDLTDLLPLYFSETGLKKVH
jgi:cytidine deaminase